MANIYVNFNILTNAFRKEKGYFKCEIQTSLLNILSNRQHRKVYIHPWLITVSVVNVTSIPACACRGRQHQHPATTILSHITVDPCGGAIVGYVIKSICNLLSELFCCL